MRFEVAMANAMLVHERDGREELLEKRFGIVFRIVPQLIDHLEQLLPVYVLHHDESLALGLESVLEVDEQLEHLHDISVVDAEKVLELNNHLNRVKICPHTFRMISSSVVVTIFTAKISPV
jgi:hypothetical protein